MQYCRSLAFDQVPDYRYLRRLLKTALEERVSGNNKERENGFPNRNSRNWIEMWNDYNRSLCNV